MIIIFVVFIDQLINYPIIVPALTDSVGNYLTFVQVLPKGTKLFLMVSLQLIRMSKK